MGDIKQLVRRLWRTRVLENYGYMTGVSAISSLIGLLLYPYVIRQIGVESYGLYAFALVLASYPSLLCTYGFHIPASKRIVDDERASRVVSTVFFSQLALVAFSMVAFVPIGMWVSIVREHRMLFFLAWMGIVSELLHPIWYFQATKNMRVSSGGALVMRLLQIPLVFLLVKEPSDNLVYMLIVVATTMGGSLFAFGYMLLHDGVRICIPQWRDVKLCYKESTPFFLTQCCSTLKMQALPTLVGALLGVRALAVYDLANKIVTLPRYALKSINEALFPEVWKHLTNDLVRSVIRKEHVIGLVAVVGIVLLSYPLTLLLGGKPLIMAFPVAVILSLTVYARLVSDAYVTFVFVPAHRYRLVTYNQLVAMVSSVALLLVSYWLTGSLCVVAASLTLSSLGEILFCWYVSRKYKLL